MTKYTERNRKVALANANNLHGRFLKKVQDTGYCWQWKGKRQLMGYGQIMQFGKMLAAHRVSFELHYGPIPLGMFICHSCDNPSCVNPEHLFIGTNKDNQQDAISKGRRKKWHHSIEAKRAISLKVLLRPRDSRGVFI